MNEPVPVSQIQLRPIADLKPYERNAKTHSDAQIAELATLIDQFGMVGAIIIRNGVIGKGHGTLAAIRLLLARGKEIYPPPGRAAGAQPYPRGFAPTLDCSGWSDTQFRAYVLSDNRIAEKSGWDREILKLELEELDFAGFDIDVTGFSERDLKFDPTPDPDDGLKYKIIVDCESEEGQRQLTETLEAQGFSVRPMTR